MGNVWDNTVVEEFIMYIMQIFILRGIEKKKIMIILIYQRKFSKKKKVALQLRTIVC